MATVTLELSDRVLEKAEDWSRARGLTLSQGIERLVETSHDLDFDNIHPQLRSLVGIGRVPGESSPSDEELHERYVDHLVERYR